MSYFLTDDFCSILQHNTEVPLVCSLPNGRTAEPASSNNRGCCLTRLVGMGDHRMQRCVALTIAMLILAFIKFEVAE